MITSKSCLLGYDKPVIIQTGYIWACDSMDTDANIIDEGRSYLLSNNEVLELWEKDYNEEVNKFIQSLRMATFEEKKQFARIARCAIFKGDEVIIARGRKMNGEKKTVLSAFRYEVRGTYGHVGTDYLRFTDGTKVVAHHCDIVGITYNEEASDFHLREFVEDNKLNSLLYCGGRM